MEEASNEVETTKAVGKGVTTDPTPPHPTPLLSSHFSKCSPSLKDQTQLTKAPDAVKGHQTFKTTKFIFITCKAS